MAHYMMAYNGVYIYIAAVHWNSLVSYWVIHGNPKSVRLHYGNFLGN